MNTAASNVVSTQRNPNGKRRNPNRTRRNPKALALPILVVMVVSFGSLVLPIGVRPAAACSCLWGELPWLMANSDAGFIGTSHGFEQVPDSEDSWKTVVSRFTVEGWTHGALDDAEIDVWSSYGYGSCGLAVGAGSTGAIFINRDGDDWTSSVCSTLSADLVRAALEPKRLPGGQAAFAVPGSFTGGGMALLDSEGRLVGYNSDFEFALVPRVYRCAGAQRALLVESRQALLIELEDLSVVKTVNLEGLEQFARIRSVHCADPVGQSMQALVEHGSEIELRDLEAIAQPGRKLPNIASSARIAIAGDYIVTVANIDGRQLLQVLDPGGLSWVIGDSDRISPIEYEIKSGPGEGAVVAISERHFAPASSSRRLWLLDPATGEEVVSRDLPEQTGAFSWLGADRLIVSVGFGEDQRAEIIDAVSLETVATVDDFAATDPVLAGDALLAMWGGDVVRGPLDGSRESVVALPVRTAGSVLALTQPMTVEPAVLEGSGLLPVAKKSSTAMSVAVAVGVLAAALGCLAAIIAGRRPGSIGPRRRSPQDW